MHIIVLRFILIQLFVIFFIVYFHVSTQAMSCCEDIYHLHCNTKKILAPNDSNVPDGLEHCDWITATVVPVPGDTFYLTGDIVSGINAPRIDILGHVEHVRANKNNFASSMNTEILYTFRNTITHTIICRSINSNSVSILLSIFCRVE